MGTRNLTCVVSGGEYKVAQYGQWDGYPEGQGKTILKFLSDSGNIENLRNSVEKCRFFDREGRDKEWLDSYDKNTPKWSSDTDNRTPEQKHWFSNYISRDLGGKILHSIISADGDEILLRSSLDFAGDSLMCEWAYVVDLDKNTFEIYKGFNGNILDKEERFFPIKAEEHSHCTYYQVKHVKTYDFSLLPTVEQFIADSENWYEKDEEE